MHLGLDRALREQGANLKAVLDAAREVVLFGSRAFGCEDPLSDWDVLLVDASRSLRIPGFDFVGVSSGESVEPAWHGSEIAIHVAEYGVWLKGKPPVRWGFDFEGVAARKRHIIGVRLNALMPAWHRLTLARRVRQFSIIRRDVQRLQRLIRRESIPPRQVLDSEWRRDELGGLPWSCLPRGQCNQVQEWASELGEANGVTGLATTDLSRPRQDGRDAGGRVKATSDE
jgi:hypothetical protein